MSKFHLAKKTWTVVLLGTGAALALPAQTTTVAPTVTFTTLHMFSEPDGALPMSPLLQAFGGKIYGTTVLGGMNDGGTLFSITPAGTLATVHKFVGADKASGPGGAFVQAADGNFYGTAGGGYGYGTIIKMTPGGAETTLYKFCPQLPCTDGWDPASGLVQGTDGNFYGTTFLGGMSGNGTVFQVTPSGVLTTLHRFTGSDGAGPIGALIQGTDGKLYGATQQAGEGYGTIFSMTLQGVFTTLHAFSGGDDGDSPYAGLVQASDGNFYGTTYWGGLTLSGCGTGCGTVFRISKSGVVTVLHEFDLTDGRNPQAALIQASDGNFYGTTFSGGANSAGAIFEITKEGIFTSLYSLCSQSNCADGKELFVPLTQYTNGVLYGEASYGGTSNDGTVFSLDVGLKPFVKPQPAFGRIGTTVILLGTNLTGATSVTFNGIPANFTVVSQSEITTTVPAGATTGTVQVVTPKGTLSSNVPFRVN